MVLFCREEGIAYPKKESGASIKTSTSSACYFLFSNLYKNKLLTGSQNKKPQLPLRFPFAERKGFEPSIPF